MEYRIFGSVLMALFFVLFSQTAMATPILGTPLCDGGGTCNVSVSLPSDTIHLTPTESFTLLVELENMQHIELFDLDSADETVNLFGLGGGLIFDNTFNGANDIAVAFDFLDMDGNVIASFLSTMFFNSSTAGCSGCGMFASGLPSSFLFHGFSITLTPKNDGTDLFLGALKTIQFTGFENNSNVGVWDIPEPGTLAIFGMGLLGLAAMRRRKVV